MCSSADDLGERFSTSHSQVDGRDLEATVLSEERCSPLAIPRFERSEDFVDPTGVCRLGSLPSATAAM
jgi:hypothetical protein